MKVVLCVIVLALCRFAFAGAGAELKLAAKSWDFGSVEQGASKDGVFVISNSGFDELAIENIHTCCGYSLKSVSAWKLAPGEKADITITCDASKKVLGEDKRYITILSNSNNNPQLAIAARAQIIPSSSAPSASKHKVIKSSIPQPQIPVIEADDLYNRISTGRDIVIFDIRKKEEQAKAYIPNSIRVPENQIIQDREYLKNILQGIEKTTFIAVIGSDGSNMENIVAYMKDLGYNTAIVKNGLKNWEEKGYPLS
jgi:rhodanese-related sulfurtransferase